MNLCCPECDTEYPDRWRCTCGTPLEFAERSLPATEEPSNADIDFRDGLWAFEEFLPVGTDPADRVTFGEGYTPMVGAPEWNATFKLEYVFPSGSFKDRGATATLTRATEVGAERVVEDSSGNAGAAIATYAARGDIDAEIYVPAGVKESKVKAIRRAGADVVRIDGSREDVTEACIDAVTDGEAWYASHAWNPAFFAGTATMAYEVAHQRNWSVPDAVVMPLGHGTMFLGAYRGFRALRDAGWIDRIPKLLGAQAAGYAPIAAELHGKDAVVGDNTIADGIQIRRPVRKASILDAIAATDGDAIALSKEAVASELERLHRAGFYTEPTCAVAPAALHEYRRRGIVKPNDDVVVPLSGSGLKG
jgi:threonine synthase